MQRGLEQALDRAEYVIQSAQQRPPKRKYSPGGGKSLHDKLYDIYVEECGKEPEVTEDLMSNVNLLEKLVRRESLSSLVVSLYPGMGGYSLLLRGENGSYTESIRLPYEEGEFLDYLDAQELPPALVDLLEKSPVNLFYSGCVIAEIRDYRQCGHGDAPGVQSRHILLRPTMQTLVCDVESIASHNPDWTQEDKLLLESQLILATAEPLCLEPCVSVACTENRLLYNRQKMNTPPMRRNLRRHSTASLGGQHELPEQPAPPELSAWDFGHHSQERQAGQPGELTFSEAGKCVDTWKQRPCDLAVPSEVDVERYAKGRRSVPYEDSHPTVWPGYEVQEGPGFGGEAGDPFQTAKLMLMQPLNDPLLCGPIKSPAEARCELPLSPCPSSNDECPDSFMPGFRVEAGRVVSLPEERVQKNLKWPVTVSQSCSGSAGLSQHCLGKEAEQCQAAPIQPSVPGAGSGHTPPATPRPWSPGKSPSGEHLTPQQAGPLYQSPPPALASKPPSVAQKSPVEGSSLPVATVSTASSAAGAPDSQDPASPDGFTIIKVLNPDSGTQTIMRVANPVMVSTAGAQFPVGVIASRLPAGGSAGPAELPPPFQRGYRYFLKTASGVKPLTVIQVPEGSVILHTQHQDQPPQQAACQLIPGEGHQQPSAYGCQQPVSHGSGAQDPSTANLVFPAQQAVAIQPREMGSLLPAEATVRAEPGSAQTRPGQSAPQHL